MPVECVRVSPGRLEAFSDGVMAIASTLLVLDLHVPVARSGISLADELGRQWPSYAAYAVSFLTIGIIWINHHAMVRRLKAVDHQIMILNLSLLLCIAALPFTTALMAAYLKHGHGQHLAAAIYSGSFLLMTVVFAATNRHILSARQTSWRALLTSAVGARSWRAAAPGSCPTSSLQL